MKRKLERPTFDPQPEQFGRWSKVIHGDSFDALRTLERASVDSVVTDPPYGLNFMGKKWDASDNIAFDPRFWKRVKRVMKPGAHLLAFGGTRTFHRLVCAIEDAGFEIRDSVAWLYGSGFPKSHDVARSIDKAAGAQGTFGEAKTEAHRRYIEKGKLRGGRGHDGWQRPWMNDPEAVANAGRQYIPATEEAARWQGWGTALKPAMELICAARKPLSEKTVAANVLKHGTGAINIDACRIATNGEVIEPVYAGRKGPENGGKYGNSGDYVSNVSPLGRWPANVIHDGSSEVLAGFPQTVGMLGVRDPNGLMGYHGGAKGLPGVVSGYADFEAILIERDKESCADIRRRMKRALNDKGLFA